MEELKSLTRRDFLKLAALTGLPAFARPLARLVDLRQAKTPNIIILVFDAWAAGHVPLYGYARNTMPNLERFADKALVYHNHISAGTFTATGAASLLSGLYPWEHRAFHIRSGIRSSLAPENIFTSLKDTHHTLAYSQNKYADKFLFQFSDAIDEHLRAGAFNLQHQSIYDLPPFRKDGLISFTAFEENIFYKVGDYDASLFLGPLLRTATLYKRKLLDTNYEGEYPKGLPDSTELFTLEDLVSGTIDTLQNMPEPALVYMHFYPPHWPYLPAREFQRVFREDGLQPVEKPPHPLVSASYDQWTLNDFREKYDAFLASWDDALGTLFAYLADSGVLQDSYVFLTSDHGEMFERGISGHTTPLIYDPLVHIPLLVSTPGQRNRQDIHANTSSLDILPTIAHLCGCPPPRWAGGELLPGLGGVEHPDRSVFTLDAKENSAFQPLSTYSMSITKGRHRLTRYRYPQYQGTEFYDLESDPGEMVDQFPARPAVALKMEQEILDTLQRANEGFAR